MQIQLLYNYVFPVHAPIVEQIALLLQLQGDNCHYIDTKYWYCQYRLQGGGGLLELILPISGSGVVVVLSTGIRTAMWPQFNFPSTWRQSSICSQSIPTANSACVSTFVADWLLD